MSFFDSFLNIMDGCRQREAKKNTGFITILILLIAVWPVCAEAAGFKMVSVAGEKVNLRKGPSTQYPVVWELGEGFPLKVIERKGSWYKVVDFENDAGWIYKNLVSTKPHLVVKVNKKNKKRVNVRSGPGTNYKIVGKAEYGVVFETLKRGDGWVKVRHEKGLTGWIKRSLLWGW